MAYLTGTGDIGHDSWLNRLEEKKGHEWVKLQ